MSNLQTKVSQQRHTSHRHNTWLGARLHTAASFLQTLRLRQMVCLLLLSVLVAIGGGATATATTPQSNSAHYSVNEVQIGAGSSQNDCSASYCAKTSVGDTVAGSGSSANYSANFGFNTSDEPLLEMITSSGIQDMGTLDTNVTGKATATVQIRNYLSNGYVLQIIGSPPSQGIRTLSSLLTPTTSQQGTEQFGINLVKNTIPNIGADPLQVPDNTFSFGAVDANYNQPNKYMYNNGDVVAHSSSSTGQTNYTISFIANISEVTAGGRYNGTFSAVVVPVY